MIGEGIQEDVLRALVQENAVRECVVAKVAGGPAWGLSIRLGGTGSRWVPCAPSARRYAPGRA